MRGGSARRVRSGVVLAAAGSLALGLVSQAAAFGFGRPGDWGPDLAVGLSWCGWGLWAWCRDRRAGALMCAVGWAWFAGGLLPAALYWHRGVLVHLLLAFPRWGPRSFAAGAAVGVGYGAALLHLPWRSDLVGGLLALALPAAVVLLRGPPTGRERAWRAGSLRTAVLIGGVLAAGSLVRAAVPGQQAVRPVLYVFEAAMCLAPVLLARALRAPRSAPVTDLVVELAEYRSGTLRDELARLLGDPALAVGYWAPGADGTPDGTGDGEADADGCGRYLDNSGRPVPAPAPGRSAARIDREGRPFAVIVHDDALLRDPRLLTAVASATRLTAATAALHREVRVRLAELASSRARLLAAADEERERLEARLRQGAERRLRTIRDRLRAAAEGSGGEDSGGKGPAGDRAAEHAARAVAQVDLALDDLRAIARGLHPRELADGLGPALASLADGGSVEVRRRLPAARLPAAVETALYYACAEALNNAAKHAGATRLEITVRLEPDGSAVARIEDDGTGGADPSGRGLLGIADRIAALGGEFTVRSPAGGGTRLEVRVPTGGGPLTPLSSGGAP